MPGKSGLGRGIGTCRRRIQGRILGTAVVALGGFAALSPAAQAGGWNAGYVYLSAGIPPSTAPAVALSSGGDAVTAWLSASATDTTTGTAELESTFDNGSSFQTVQGAGDADPLVLGDGDYPQVAQDAAGDTVVTWIEDGEVMAGYKAAGSVVFSTSTLDAPGQPYQDERPQVALDLGGNGVIAWEQFNSVTAKWTVWRALVKGPSFGSAVALDQPGVSTPDATTVAPTPEVAVDATGGAVIVWTDNEQSPSSIDYTYASDVTNPASFVAPVYGYTAPAGGGTTLSQPVVAINDAGDLAVAWVTDASNEEVWEADLPASGAESRAALVQPDSASSSQGGGPLGSRDELDPAIAMKTDSTNNDETTSLAFYDGADNVAVVFVRPNVDYGEGWEALDASLWNAGGSPHNWTSEPAGFTGSGQAPSEQPQLALTSSPAGDSGPATMVWYNNGAVDSVTSDVTGSFSGSGVQTLSSSAACPATLTQCVAVASDPSGDLVAAWEQDDASSNLQVVADCYQGSSGPASSFAAGSCVKASNSGGQSGSSTGQSSPGAGSSSGGGAPSNGPPAVAQTIGERTTSGTVLVEVPGSGAFVNSDTLPLIPNGSVLNATAGHVQLTFALPNGQTEQAMFWGGEFRVDQSAGGAVTATLAGGSFSGCPVPPGRGHTAAGAGPASVGARRRLRATWMAGAKRAPAKKPSSVVRSLWADAKGNYTTKGRDGAASVLGTTWLTRDQCDGTDFSVRRATNDRHGEIRVTAYHPRRHTVLVKRGKSYLAPAPGYG